MAVPQMWSNLFGPIAALEIRLFPTHVRLLRIAEVRNRKFKRFRWR